MLGLISTLTCFAYAAAQNFPPVGGNTPLTFTNTSSLTPLGNYTMGYVNNTVQNRCHRAIAKFQSQQTGIVDSMSLGVYSRATTETCGISFVLSTFPDALAVGQPLLTTITDLVAPVVGTDEYVNFNASSASWGLVAGQNYTVTILPFTWATGGSAGGTTRPSEHCVFDVPYGRLGIPYAAIGQYGPTGQPCGATPWTADLAGDGWALQFALSGHAAPIVLPSMSPSKTPTPTSSSTPTPSQTGTPTPSATSTGTPTNTETPTQTLAPGSSPSNSPTSSRTPSRTPSISYTPTPSSSVTPSQTPTETPSPTPSLRIGASPSVTPTETPGPTDSPSPKPVAGIGAAPVIVQAPAQMNAGTIIGAAVGGGLLVTLLIAVAIRFKIVSAQLNTPTVKAWTPGKRSKKTRVPDMDIDLNSRITTNPSFTLRIQKMKEPSTPRSQV